MMFPFTRLPAELWTLVFGHLSLADRLNVRATCKHFQELVDITAVSADFTVELEMSGEEYTEHFWRALRGWRVTSARLRSPHGWKRIAKELPRLTTLTLHCDWYLTGIWDLRSFPNLERLFLTQTMGNVVHLEDLALMPAQLTHLSVCQPMWVYCIPLPPDISTPELPFKKLKCLVCHRGFKPHLVDVLHFFLCALPELEHISLSPGIMSDLSLETQLPDLRSLRSCPLTSLELVECELRDLPMDFGTMLSALPFLRSLAIFCVYYDENFEDHFEKLSVWLDGLPTLSSLLVRGVDVARFVESIPSSVTRLTLMPKRLLGAEMRALSARLPNLRHLHLDPYRVLLTNIGLIPWLFPRLRSLRIPLRRRVSSRKKKQVPVSVLLSLASLQELELLELLEEEPPPAELVSKLRALTRNRVRVQRRPEKDQLQKACDCIPDIHCRTSSTWD